MRSPNPREQGSETQSPNREQLLQMAIDAGKAGNKNAARLMFRRIVTEDKNNERALMWLAKLADTKKERAEWLQSVLRVNPNNQEARRALQRMQYKTSARDNRTLLIFGVVAGILIVFAVVIVIVLTSAGGGV